MKASDLSEVNRLTALMGERLKKHEMLKGLLMAGKHGLPHKVRIEIGGDSYGNGSYKMVTADLQDVKYVVDLVAKEISEEWGKIVLIRAKLRDLGVEL